MSRLLGLPDIPTFTSLKVAIKFPRPVTTGDRLGLFDFNATYVNGIWVDDTTNVEGDFPFAEVGGDVPSNEIVMTFRAIVVINGKPLERVGVYKVLPIENIPGAIDLGRGVYTPGSGPDTIPPGATDYTRFTLPTVFEPDVTALPSTEETIAVSNFIGRVAVSGSIANIGDDDFHVTIYNFDQVAGPLTLQARTSLDITFPVTSIKFTPINAKGMRYQVVIV